MPPDAPTAPPVPDGDGDFPLLRLIDRIRATEETIRARVERHRERLSVNSDLRGVALDEALAAELVDDARWRAAGVGAALAAPFTIPFLGFWGTLAATVIGAAIWQLAIEVELVYALAAAYRSPLPPDRLRMVSFWLIQLTNFDDLRGRALTIGVRLTVRKLVEKLLAVGLARAFEATAHAAMMGRMMGTVAPGEAWYVRATRYLGMPVLFYFGWKSAAGVGSRATDYFREERGLAVVDGGRSMVLVSTPSVQRTVAGP